MFDSRWASIPLDHATADFESREVPGDAIGFPKGSRCDRWIEAFERVLDHVHVLAAIHDSEVIVYHVRPKAYSGAATISLDEVSVVSNDDAVNKLNKAGFTAHAVEEDV